MSGDDTRARIVAAALDVFSEVGYDGAATREICERAGVNGAALNYHFRSKEKLWLAIVDQTVEHLAAASRQAMVGADSPRAALRALVGGLFDVFRADPRPARLMMWMALQAGRLDFRGTLDRFAPVITAATSYFRVAQDAGALAADRDLPVLLPLLFGQFVYTFIAQPGQRYHFGRDLTDDAFARRVRAALIRSGELLLGFDDAAANSPAKKRSRAPRRRARSGVTT